MSRRSAFPLAVLLLSALLLESGCQLVQDKNRDVPISETRARLIKILDSRRLTEGRLRGFSYALFLSNRPGPELSKDQRIELRKLLREPPDSTPEAAADRALLKWVAGDFEEAIRGLEEALASAPATLLSDLSALYLANARRKDDPYSRVKALEAAESAIALDPSLQEARFNRALALESLFLGRQARSAWDDSLKLDGSSGWADEARTRQRALEEPDAASRWDLESQKLTAAFATNDQATIDRIVRSFPQAARESVEEKLFGEWASAALGKRSAEAREKLAAARAIGAALVKANGERMVQATVEAIDRADSTRLPLLANGHSLYQQGLGLYNEGKFAEARDRFAAARAALDHAESPFAGWATFRLAVSEMQLFHYERALALLAGLDRSGFQSLAGRSLWVEGLILAIQGKYMESIAVYRSALRHFEAIGERENLAVVRSLTAECLAALGDFPGAWKLHLDALSLVGALRNPARRQQVFEQASSTALQVEKPAATLDFLQEALGTSSSVPPAAVYCLRRKALAHRHLGRPREAERDLQEARAMVSRFPDEHVRKSMLGDLLAAEGGIIASRDPFAGIARLTEAIQTYDQTGYSAQLALLLAERARAYRAVAETALAESDLQRAISLVRSQRSLVDDRGLQVSYLKEFSSIFDDMVDLQLRLGHKERALDFVESSRAQVLRELLADARGELVGKVATVGDLQKALPESVAIIEYHVLPGKLLAWVIRRESLDVLEAPIRPEELRLRVESFRNKVLSTSVDPRRDPGSRRLFDLLIGKLAPSLQGAEVLVLVPDRDLHSLPFAALPDGDSGNYLVNRYALSVAPSVNVYLEALGHERRLERAGRALVIGDPAFDLHGVQALPRLPGAEAEAEAVAAMYPGSELLLGPEATWRGFLDGLHRFGMIHFAGHAVGNSAHPLSSFLVACNN